MIAHRLSTIALADDIVVLEGGRVIARGDPRRAARASSPLYAEIAAKGLPDQVFLTAQAGRAGVAGYRRPATDHRPRAARGARPAAAGELRGLPSLLRPYRGRVALMFVALLFATAAALAPPPLAKLAIDDGIVPGDRDR